ncbi:MAG: YggS family pyridoxal phosphate-dependent enzyme [Planctomycetes bacterium]|nr:YggS family pyridoxal phosphate-dependent enzyme [Planctomycetota bacterium]
MARIAAACERSGRNPEDVTLVAVTKTVGIEEVRALYELGVRDFGENRAEVALSKTDEITEADINWHFIGHLQRNKAKKVLDGYRIIHSLESLKLAEIISAQAVENNFTASVFIEVNVAGEVSKYGIAPDKLENMAGAVLALTGLEVRGLMTMAPFSDNPEDARPYFRRLREMRDRLSASLGKELPGLSMGMSGDFEVAIEEGATLVRVGTALFE